QMRRLVPVFTEGQTDDLSLTQGQRNLQDYFERRGYFSVSVTWKRETSVDSQKLKITYTVALGPHGRFVGIGFRGNHHVSDQNLISILQLQPEEFGHARGIFSRALLASDLKAITDSYQARGFLEVKVTPVLNEHSGNAPDRLFVTFSVDEGPETTVNRLTL